MIQRTRSSLILPLTTITTAVSNQLSPEIHIGEGAAQLIASAVFTYGTAGTTAKFWLQSKIGDTWMDIANFAFLLATATKVIALTSLITVASVAPTDGTLADDAINDGLLGDLLRIKFTTTGTYATSTTIKIDVLPRG